MKNPLHNGIAVLILVIILILLGGCSQKAHQDADPGAGVAAELGEPFRPITLQEGISEVKTVFTGEQQSFDPLPLYYFQARGISSEGKAEQWILGIKFRNDSYFVQVESNRVVLMPGQVSLPENEINPSAIIQPGALITTNRQLIGRSFSMPEQNILLDLEMSENIYTVTPRGSNAYKILYFNAQTGKSLN